MPHGLPAGEAIHASSILGDKAGDNAREHA
jgi:hypothetical protein